MLFENLFASPLLWTPPIRYANQFDMAYQNWGFWGMVLFYPVLFLNFLSCIKIIEYGIESGWGQDLIYLLTFSAMFLPIMIGIPLIWEIQRMVVN